MASREMSWQSAFWSLPPLAVNSMMQPSGKICGFNPSLRTYLRASPIVCAFDAVAIIIRFIAYNCVGHSPRTAARKVINARDGHREDTELGGIRSLEQVLFLRCVWFVIGVLPQAIKLMACSGLSWTQAWGSFYLVSFAVVEVMNILAKSTVKTPESAGDIPLEASSAGEEPNSTGDDSQEYWMALCDKTCGAVAVLLQLTLLAWVDLASPDLNFRRRWEFHLLRLSAHFVVFLIHIPLMALQSDTAKQLPNRRLGAFVMSTLLTYILLASLEGLNFSQRYFMCSVIISSTAWLLYFSPVTKNHVLLCGSRDGGYQNVLAFDFFCRTLCFSLFWYVVHYDPTGTFKPEWTDVLG